MSIHHIFYRLIFMTIALSASAQNQNNFWVYGIGAGIDFNTDPPSFVGGNAIQAYEGSASIADPVSGELLFYTNGVTVWDATNNVMPNGGGLLGGNPVELSSTTAAVIAEKPGSANEYYLFTIDQQFGGNGLRYSVVNMNLNGGLGDVVTNQKNISVLSTNSEKMCLAPNSQGTGYWLITHNGSDSYFAYAVTSSGVSSSPVISFVGPSQGNGAGFMKMSPQLDRIAVTNISLQNAEVYDFDRTTGAISNPLVIDYAFAGAAGGPYGIEFSCSGRYLYVSDGSNLTQFDLDAGSTIDVIASAYTVLSGSFSCYGLQLGPDLKIYVSNGILDVIENPDSAGPNCNYSSGAISAQTSGGGWGLPQWVYRIGDDAVVCETCEPITTNASALSCGPYNTPNGDVYTTSGDYIINLLSSSGCDSIVSLNLTIAPPPLISITQEQIGCGNQSEVTITAIGSSPFEYIIQTEGSSNTTGIFILDAGTYTVLVTDVNGCSVTETIDNSNAGNCQQDFDQDWVVGVSDLIQFVAAYGCTVNCCPYDLNGDQSVSVADLLLFISVFGDVCE